MNKLIDATCIDGLSEYIGVKDTHRAITAGPDEYHDCLMSIANEYSLTSNDNAMQRGIFQCPVCTLTLTAAELMAMLSRYLDRP